MKIKIPKPICIICKRVIPYGEPLCYECMKCDKCSPQCFVEERNEMIGELGYCRLHGEAYIKLDGCKFCIQESDK